MNMRWSAVNQNDNMRRNSFGTKISVSFFYDNQQFVRRSGSKNKIRFYIRSTDIMRFIRNMSIEI